ncbi:MAG: DNA ligase (NAD(+)) LigA [Bacteroidetes bacterium]|nr:DNA ligase (NAD(+)) LigA [Bacteroidota bacterium]
MNQAELLQLTDRLLSLEIAATTDPQKTMEDLQRVINLHDRKYYVDSDPLITDFDYDVLFKKLKALEEAYPLLITADSPTQRVAHGLNTDFPTVQHLIPMMSLDNSYNADDLNDFDRRVREALPSEEQVHYTVELKYDGSSIALVYENDLLVRAATRGNGIEGDEITNNARTIRTVPLSADFSKYGIAKVEVRGEVLIEFSAFNKLNEQRMLLNEKLKDEGKKELELFKHARNTASGALRLKDPKDVASRNLDAVIYQIGYAEDAYGNEVRTDLLNSHHENMNLLHSLGFKTPVGETGKFASIDDVVAFCDEWESKRDTYPYEIDGMVIKVDSRYHQNLIGGTAHHPRWAIAFKFKAKQAITQLLDIDYQVGRTGAVTPVAKLEPVILTGVEISSVSLHNEDFITDKDIRFKDHVVVERAGDVIPYIVGPVTQRRTGLEEVVQFPAGCPSCREKLVKPVEESIWRCINPDCPAQLEERMIHFVSKGAMNIDGLGRDIVKRFIQEGIIGGLEDIYALDYERISALEGWKERSVEKLRSNVEASKSNANWRLLVGLGIRHIGSTTAKMLVKQVNGLIGFKEWTEEQLLELEDIGPKVAASITEFFGDDHNLGIIQRLADLSVNIESEEEVLVSNVLEGKTFLFTGALSMFSRDEAKAMVDEHGGKNLSGVSAKLNYLVAGEKAGSKLVKAQKLGTVEIMSEADFLKLIGK